MFTVMENLVVYACNFWLIWNPCLQFWENIGQLIFVWVINVNVCMLILNLLASNEKPSVKCVCYVLFQKIGAV